MTSAITYLDEPEKVRRALSPIRLDVLHRLRSPASATQLAAALGVPRQRVNYHLRALEQAGLVELVEERPRRGCVERIMRTRPGAFVVDPSVMTVDKEFTKIHDQYAAEHLVGAAAATVRDVARMQEKSAAAGKRLLTFTVEAEVRFAQPADVHTFTDALAEAIRSTIERFDTPGGRPYRMVAGGHPTPAEQGETHDQD